MKFHRGLMRNRARRLAGNRGLASAWPGVRAWRWQAGGCLAEVRPARLARRRAVRAAEPSPPPPPPPAAGPAGRGVRAVLRRVMGSLRRRGAARGV